MKNLEDESRGRCLECGDVLPYGRSDMKFCCSSCKNRYHYARVGHLKGVRLRTIGALDRNHEILDALLKRGVTSINIPDLGQMGYRFDCVTSSVRSVQETLGLLGAFVIAGILEQEDEQDSDHKGVGGEDVPGGGPVRLSGVVDKVVHYDSGGPCSDRGSESVGHQHEKTLGAGADVLAGHAVDVE